MKRIVLPIVGMHCASCSRLIEKKLVKVQGVSSASVNYGSEQASLEYDPQISGREDFVKAVEEAGYKVVTEAKDSGKTIDEIKEEIKTQELKNLKTKVLISAILNIVVILGSFPEIVSRLVPFFYLSNIYGIISNPFTLLILATPIQFWAGREFYQAAWSGIKNRTASMDTLISVGTTSAYGFSLLTTLFGSSLQKLGFPMTMYFDTSATIITLILAGRYLETKAKAHTSGAIKKLIGLKAKTARVVRKDSEIDIPLEEVKVGDIIRVRPGEKVPVDGVIIEGITSIDESMVTGESMPVDKTIKSLVIGGTLNKSGTFLFKATKVGEETVLSNIVRLVSEAQSSKAQIQRLADKVSSYFVPAVLVIGILTFISWYDLGTFSQAFTNMISVFIIACPCALGLATPTAIMVGIGKGAEKGILIKDAEALETAHDIESVVFDKTGTLTLGKPQVNKVLPTDGLTSDDILRIAASLERGSEHSLGEAIIKFADEKNIRFRKVDAFKAHPGMGIEGEIAGHKYYLGNSGLIKQMGVSFQTNEGRIDKSESSTVVFLASEKKILGRIAISDSIKPEAKKVVEELQKRNIGVWMLTGDNEKTAASIASYLGIKNYLAGVYPDEKAQKIEKLKSETHSKVAFIGDGVNDAPALAASTVGIAMGTGTDVAIESAGVTLLNKSLRNVVSIIDLSRATISTIKQNLFWAFGYNVILIPVAAGVLYPIFGILLNPALAAFAMAASSISVVGNSLRLKTVKI